MDAQSFTWWHCVWVILFGIAYTRDTKALENLLKSMRTVDFTFSANFIKSGSE